MKTTSEYPLPVATEAMEKQRKENIGKKPLSRQRRATIDDTYTYETHNGESHKVDSKEGWNAYANEQFLDKEGLDDSDLRDVAVARIDEQMLDLELTGDMNSPAVTKHYNDLRDMKDFIVNRFDSDWDNIWDTVDQLKGQQGSEDEAAVGQAAIDFMGQITSEAMDFDGDNLGEHPQERTKEVIDAHNERIRANEQKRARLQETQTTPAFEAPQEILDVADSPAEAQEMLYSQPDLLEALFNESSAYNDFLIAHRDEFPNATKQFDIGLKSFNKNHDAFKAAMEGWKTDSLGFASFDAYTKAISSGDVDVSDNLWEAVSDARQLMKNKSWSDRKSQAMRRMVRRNTDKSEVLSVGAKFAREYFK